VVLLVGFAGWLAGLASFAVVVLLVVLLVRSVLGGLCDALALLVGVTRGRG